jgi:deaminated glutathione amidase
MEKRLRIAAVQFPVSADVASNSAYIMKQIKQAASEKADVVLFPETALPGYAPKHHPERSSYDWSTLARHEQEIARTAEKLRIWVVYGTVHPVEGCAPRNCLRIVSPEGKIAGRYDKRKLYGKETRHYSSGHAPTVVDVNGVKCGFLICYDNCFPELYAEYRELGVEVLFHSFLNAENTKPTPIKDLMLANLIVRAADHGFWIAASNSSQPYCPLSACLVRPDGSMVRSRRHLTGIVVDDFPSAELGWTYDNRQTAPAAGHVEEAA